VRITFQDEHGNNEAGVDGGGLFKEFLTSLIKIAFDPAYALFRETADHFMYPNPEAELMIDFDQHMQYFGFIGRVIGKALYDGIQIEPRFTNFFLRAILGQYNFLDDLQTLDPEMYKSLIFLKSYEGDFEDLGLTFSITRAALGENREVDLIPNGSQIAVTRDNLSRFLYLMADYKLNKEIAKQSSVFFAGLRQVVELKWLNMFAADELGTLLSGSERIDFKDLQANTTYTGGFSASHELIIWFWEIMETLDPSSCAQFLKFVTSCPRAPLLGFKTLNPGFSIQHVGNNQHSLPTAATCFNLLRLPRYMSKQLLREKLLYAIHSGTGFELS